MSSQETVQRFHQLAWSEGALGEARALLADDLVDHDALEFPGRAPGADGLLQVVAMIRAAMPDLQRTIEQQITEGDRVVTRFRDHGTHEGELMGIPPTGRPVTLSGINIETVRDGRIAEVWHVEDLLGLMRQVGVVPESA
jgi:steroid delta-isomerase-like uncharacterized protein